MTRLLLKVLNDIHLFHIQITHNSSWSLFYYTAEALFLSILICCHVQTDFIFSLFDSLNWLTKKLFLTFWVIVPPKWFKHLLLFWFSLSCWWASFSPALAVGQTASHLSLEYFGIQRSSWWTQWLQGAQVLWLQNKPSITLFDSCYEVFMLISCVWFSPRSLWL